MQESVWAFQIQIATQQTDSQVANSQHTGCSDHPFWLFKLGLAETGADVQGSPLETIGSLLSLECESETLAVVVKQRFLVFIPDLRNCSGSTAG